MTLTLYFHPLSSYCQKVLTALYENDTPFEKRLVNLGDAEDAAALKKLWPIGKFPVLRDEAKDRTIPESSIIIEYLDRNYPGKAPLIPNDDDLALETRQADRFHDLCVQAPMQAIVFDRLKPKEARDAVGVGWAKSQLRTALDMLEMDMANNKLWATGDQFSMADCAAAPALYYANLVMPFADTHKHVAAYFDRLMQRPSFARAVEEAEPYRHMFPQE
jgi:glutathione S-transferase